jgi:hypothetical protein
MQSKYKQRRATMKLSEGKKGLEKKRSKEEEKDVYTSTQAQ